MGDGCVRGAKKISNVYALPRYFTFSKRAMRGSLNLKLIRKLRALNFVEIYFRGFCGFLGLLEKIKFRGNLFSRILFKKRTKKHSRELIFAGLSRRKFHGNLISREIFHISDAEFIS